MRKVKRYLRERKLERYRQRISRVRPCLDETPRSATNDLERQLLEEEAKGPDRAALIRETLSTARKSEINTYVLEHTIYASKRVSEVGP